MKSLLTVSLVLACGAGSAAGQSLVLEDQVLRAAGTLPHSQFGTRVALLGERIVVTLPDLPLAQVFRDDGAGFVHEADLSAPDADAGDWFGVALATSGQRCVVGSPRHDGAAPDAGAAYVFVFDGSAWSLEQKLVAGDAEADDQFGQGVAIDGDRVVVGAPRADVLGQVDQGVAYVFERSGSSWVQSAVLTGPDGVGNDGFGWVVGLDGGLLVVSSIWADAGFPYSGAAYGFRDAGAGFAFEHKFTLPPGSGPYGTFAQSLDVDGDRVACGWPYGGDDSGGRVFVFERTLGVWDAGYVCAVPYGVTLDQLGTSVALCGERLLSGAYYDRVWKDGLGSACLFEKVGSDWLPQLRLIPSSAALYGVFGTSVDMDGTRMVVGAPQEGLWEPLPPSADRAYVYAHRARVGDALCAGDGSVAPCPCGNESEAGLGFGCENAYGYGANLAGSGSAGLASDDLLLSVEHLTRAGSYPYIGTLVQLIAGTDLLSGTTFGDGLRCAGGSVLRVGPPLRATHGGQAWWGPGLSLAGGWTAGQTLYFQVFYRDPVSGGCGSHVNTSNALSVTFTP